jgi:predicted membrane protein (TIGR00267 family)
MAVVPSREHPTPRGAERLRGVEAAPRRARGAALIRDVILGGQDGLVNVLGLVLGMSVATGSTRVVVTAGLAALLAESIAMAGVAFTASGAERQLGATLRKTLDERREALARVRDSARRERLAEAGLSDDVVALVVDEAEAEASTWRDQVELMRTALAPVRETRPVRAAAVVGVSTALGSAVPLLPFVLLPISIAPVVALVASAVVLALAGMERAHTTGGRKLRAAVEMVAIGLVSALAGYLIGVLLGGPVS